MSIKVKQVLACDFCGKEINQEHYIHIDDVPNEGCSSLHLKEFSKTLNSFAFSNTDYCNMNCLFNDINMELKS